MKKKSEKKRIVLKRIFVFISFFVPTGALQKKIYEIFAKLIQMHPGPGQSLLHKRGI